MHRKSSSSGQPAQPRKSVRPQVRTEKPKRALRLMLLGLDSLFQNTQDTAAVYSATVRDGKGHARCWVHIKSNGIVQRRVQGGSEPSFVPAGQI